MSCSVINSTPFQVMAFPAVDADGRKQQVLVVKGTWRLSSGRVVESERQLPMLRLARYQQLGELPLEPAQRSVIKGREAQRWLRHDSDHLQPKACFDVIVNAWAQLPDARPRTAIECAVSYRDKPLLRLLAHAPRVWRRSMGGMANPVIEHVAPVSRIPLIYPFAFGGDPAGADASVDPWPGNQNGMGYCVRHDVADGVPLPWIEAPAHPIRQWNDHPEPIALGHTDPADLPRRGLQGTFDEQWRNARAPSRPLDFDPRHYNAAPEPLQLRSPPRAGELISLHHLGKQARIDVRLPAVCLRASAQTMGGVRLPVQTMVWDSLLIEPEEDHYALTWRTTFTDSAAAPLQRIAVRACLESSV